MKTETELVCRDHFGDYQTFEMIRRKATPVDISPLVNPIDGLCERVRDADIAKAFPEQHNKEILAVTWKIEESDLIEFDAKEELDGYLRTFKGYHQALSDLPTQDRLDLFADNEIAKRKLARQLTFDWNVFVSD